MGEADYDVLGPAFMNFKEASVIHDASDDLIHVVWFVRIIRNYLIEKIGNPSRRISRFDKWSFLFIV